MGKKKRKIVKLKKTIEELELANENLSIQVSILQKLNGLEKEDNVYKICKNLPDPDSNLMKLFPHSNNGYCCKHEYPEHWFSILPPACTKCGNSESPWNKLDYSVTGSISF